jgi:indole-3-glycerol phosphate synthase
MGSTILDKIIMAKREEVQYSRMHVPESALASSEYFHRSALSMKQALRETKGYAIIAEYKRKSPSMGEFPGAGSLSSTTATYVRMGFPALSILTDGPYFGGSADDLKSARGWYDVPILRKDFIIDAYQITEAKSWGADVVLLIAECLSKSEIEDLAHYAQSLGLEVLLEMHSAAQLNKVPEWIDCVGVNNRNLASFEVDVQTSFDMIHDLPKGVVKISESGIKSMAVMDGLLAAGYEGFLIGGAFLENQQFMKALEQKMQL